MKIDLERHWAYKVVEGVTPGTRKFIYETKTISERELLEEFLDDWSEMMGAKPIFQVVEGMSTIRTECDVRGTYTCDRDFGDETHE